MRVFYRSIVSGAVLFGLGLVSSALAASVTKGNLTIEQPWARASAGRMANGAAFMIIRNDGAEADRLVAAATPVAATAELHTHSMANGVMEMRQVPAVDIPAKSATELKPGGLHVMLMNLKQPLAEGSTFPVTLTFAKAGEVTVEVTVGSVGALGMPGMGGPGMGPMGGMHGH